MLCTLGIGGGGPIGGEVLEGNVPCLVHLRVFMLPFELEPDRSTLLPPCCSVEATVETEPSDRVLDLSSPILFEIPESRSRVCIDPSRAFSCDRPWPKLPAMLVVATICVYSPLAFVFGLAILFSRLRASGVMTEVDVHLFLGAGCRDHVPSDIALVDLSLDQRSSVGKTSSNDVQGGSSTSFWPSGTILRSSLSWWPTRLDDVTVSEVFPLEETVLWDILSGGGLTLANRLLFNFPNNSSFDCRSTSRRSFSTDAARDVARGRFELEKRPLSVDTAPALGGLGATTLCDRPDEREDV